MEFYPDVPLKPDDEDRLGLSTFVDQLHRAVLSARPPFVFGVLGDWGTGKTSALRLLQNKIAAHQYVVPIWFDAWRYENETNILYPLLHAIKKTHEEIAPTQQGSFQRAFVDIVGASAFAVGDALLRSITKSITGDATSVEDLEGHLERIRKHKDTVAKVLEAWGNEVGHLSTAFASLLREFANDIARVRAVDAGAVRFVILIDDLDRCLPDTTIRLLENIKNHLDAENTVFVLALNAAVINQGIRHKYRGVEVNGREYLEKILNFSFYVPAPDSDALVTFVGEWLGKVNKVTGVDRTTYFTEFARALQDCRFNNPRKIKRVVNRYVMFLDRPEAELTKFRLGTLARLLMLAEYFPDVFQLLRDYIETQDGSRSFAQFEAEKFIGYYQQETGANLFSRYPQLVIMRKLFDLRETTNSSDNSLRIHAAIVYQLTRLV